MAELLPTPVSQFHPAAEFPRPLGLPQFPDIFRVTSIRHVILDYRLTQTTATLFHEQAAIKVTWNSNHPDIRIKAGELVSPRWPVRVTNNDGSIRISRLVLLERPEPGFNLFLTVPSGWVKDRGLVSKAANLMEELPTPYQHLFNAIFWNGTRFRNFCVGPSSLKGHHNGDNGNLRHTAEVANTMRDLCRTREGANPDLGILLGFLHDAGKADEYALGPKGNWVMSDRGWLLGHRQTITEWIAAAMARHRILLTERQYLAIQHCLSASPYAPESSGNRRPRMKEALLLSMADRYSGSADLMERYAANDGGWGEYHGHIGGRVFSV